MGGNEVAGWIKCRAAGVDSHLALALVVGTRVFAGLALFGVGAGVIALIDSLSIQIALG